MDQVLIKMSRIKSLLMKPPAIFTENSNHQRHHHHRPARRPTFSYWLLLLITKYLVTFAFASTSFSWSMEEDRRFYIPNNYHPYRNIRSHGPSPSNYQTQFVSVKDDEEEDSVDARMRSKEAQKTNFINPNSMRTRGPPKQPMTPEDMIQYIDRVTRGEFCLQSPNHGSDELIRRSNSPSLSISTLMSQDDRHQLTNNNFNNPSSSLLYNNLLMSSQQASSPSSSGTLATPHHHHPFYASSPSRDIPPQSLRLKYNQTAARVDLLNAILIDYKPNEDGYRFLKKSFHEMINLDKDIIHARIIWLSESNTTATNNNNPRSNNNSEGRLNGQFQESNFRPLNTENTINYIKPVYYYTAKRKRTFFTLNINRTISPYEPWFDFEFKSASQERLFDHLLVQQYIPRSQLSSFLSLDSPTSVQQNPTPTANNNMNQTGALVNPNNKNSNKKEHITNNNELNNDNKNTNNNENSNKERNNNNNNNNNKFNNKCPKFTSWTNAYYSCDYQIWLFSYTSLIIFESIDSCILRGIISVDIDIGKIDINQCDHASIETTIPLLGTHKCHRPSSKVSLSHRHLEIQ